MTTDLFDPERVARVRGRRQREAERRRREAFIDPTFPNPDEEGRIRSLADRAEIPEVDVRADIEAASVAADAADAERALAEAPRLREWLSDPRNSAIARDDIDNLSAFERFRRDLNRETRGGGDSLIALALGPAAYAMAGADVARGIRSGDSDPLQLNQRRLGQEDVEAGELQARLFEAESRGETLSHEDQARLDELSNRAGADDYGTFIVGPTMRLLPQIEAGIGAALTGGAQGAVNEIARLRDPERAQRERLEASQSLVDALSRVRPVPGRFGVWVSLDRADQVQALEAARTLTYGGGVGREMVMRGGEAYFAQGYRMELGGLYYQLRQEGIDQAIAARYAQGYAEFATGVELAGAVTGFRLSALGGVAARLVGRRAIVEGARPLMRAALAAGGQIAEGAAEQASEEATQRAAEIIYGELARQDQVGDPDIAEAWRSVFTPENIASIIQAGSIGAQGGAGMSSVPAAVNLSLDVRAVREAERAAAAFEEATRAAQASRTGERRPADLEAAVEAVTEGDQVYMDADRFVEHFQSLGQDAFAAATELGLSRETLAAAINAHGQISLPLGRYASRLLRDPQHAKLTEHTRATPDAATPAEAREATQQLEAYVEEIKAEAEAAKAGSQTAQALEERFLAAAQDTAAQGGMNARVARPVGRMVRAMATTMLSRAQAGAGTFAERMDAEFRRLAERGFGMRGPNAPAEPMEEGASLVEQGGRSGPPVREETWNPPEGVRLTERERKIAEMAINGAGNDWIAEEMDSSRNTVGVTLNKVKRLLGGQAPWEAGKISGRSTEVPTETLVRARERMRGSVLPKRINARLAEQFGMTPQAVSVRLLKYDRDRAQSGDLGQDGAAPTSIRNINNTSDEALAAWYDANVKETETDWGVQLTLYSRDGMKRRDVRIELQDAGDGSFDGVTFWNGGTERKSRFERAPTPEETARANRIFVRVAAAVRVFAQRRNPKRISFSGATDAHDRMYRTMLSVLGVDGYEARQVATVTQANVPDGVAIDPVARELAKPRYGFAWVREDVAANEPIGDTQESLPGAAPGTVTNRTVSVTVLRGAGQREDTTEDDTGAGRADRPGGADAGGFGVGDDGAGGVSPGPEAGQAGELNQGGRDPVNDPVNDPEYRARLERVRSRIGQKIASGLDETAQAAGLPELSEQSGHVAGRPGPLGIAPTTDLTGDELRDLISVSGGYISSVPFDKLRGYGLYTTHALKIDTPFATSADDVLHSEEVSIKAGGPTRLEFSLVSEEDATAIRPAGVHLVFSRVNDAARGHEIGLWMYRHLIEWATRQGLEVYSDGPGGVSLAAQSTYKKLAALGYAVDEYAPSVRHPDGALVSDRGPVFKVSGYGREKLIAAPPPRDDYQIDGPGLRERIAASEGQSGNLGQPIFYSAIQRALEQSTTARASGAQWWATISKAAGVKREELEWIGLEDWLSAQAGPIAREDVLAFVRENGVRVEETVLGGDESVSPEVQRELLPLIEERDRVQAALFNGDLKGTIAAATQDARVQAAYRAYQEAEGAATDALARELDAADPRVVSEDQWAWVIESSWGQRRVSKADYERRGVEGALDDVAQTDRNRYDDLHRLEKQRRLELRREASDLRSRLSERISELEGERRKGAARWSRYTLPGGENYRELVLHVPSIEPYATIDTAHYGDVGGGRAIAWIRFKERVDANGRRTLHIDEFQSKRHQDGRERGYKTSTLPDGWTVREPGEQPYAGTDFVVFSDKGEMAATGATREQAIATALDQLNALQRVPDAPFKNNAWAALALKRMIRWAAENGFDQIAWTPGQVQVERFNLAKFVDELSLVEDRNMRGEPMGRRLLVARKDGRQVFEREITDDAQVVEYVGKDAAERLLAAPVTDGQRQLTGLDLDTGGSGMRAFYDRILVNIANDLGKKFGAKVGEAAVPVPPTQAQVSAYRPSDFAVEQRGDQWAVTMDRSRVPGQPLFDTREEAQATLRSILDGYADVPQPVHALPITDAMREAAMEGQALFQQPGAEGRRGALKYEGWAPGRFGDAMVKLFDEWDPSTPLHEVGGHLFHLILESMALDPEAPADIKQMWADTLNWWGVDQATWSRLDFQGREPYFERWARTFEAYAMEGKAPSLSLRDVFQTFMRWLLAVYRDIRTGRIRLNHNLTPEIARVFDRMLATDAEIAEARALSGADVKLKREHFRAMSDEEWAGIEQAYVEAEQAQEADLRARTMARFARKQKRWWRAEREARRDEAMRDVDADPARRAEAWLSAGEWVAVPPVDLDEDAGPAPQGLMLAMPEALPEMTLDAQALASEWPGVELPASLKPRTDLETVLAEAMSLKRATKDKQAQRLWAFIKANGGIDLRYVGEDQRARIMAALGSGRRLPGLINNASGKSPDEILTLAARAGYFGEAAARELRNIRIMDEDDVTAVVADIVRARDLLKEQPPQTLTEFVRRQGEVRDDRGRIIRRGGIMDDRGDLAGGASDGRPGFASLLSPTGVQMDYALRAATEVGFFTEEPTQAEFIDALDAESRGQTLTNDPTTTLARADAEAVIAFYQRAGIDTNLSEADLRRRVKGMTAPSERASAQAMDIPFDDEVISPPGQSGEAFQGDDGGAVSDRQPDIEELISALVADLEGSRQVYSALEPGALPEAQRRASARQWFEARGIDLSATKETIRAQIAAALEADAQDVRAVHPDEAAPFFGFGSGDELVRALAALKPRAQAIEERIDAITERDLGDQGSPERVKRAALEAAHVETTARSIEMELAAITKAAGGRVTPANKRAQEAAADMIQGMTLGEIGDGSVFLAGERRAAKRAMEAMAKGDMAEAARQKSRQLLSFHLYRLALDTHKQATRMRERWDRYASNPTTRAAIGPKHIEQIDAILDMLETGRVNFRPEQTLAEWVAEREAADEADLLTFNHEVLAATIRRPLKQLQWSEVQDVDDALRNIETIGRNVIKLKNAREAQRIADIQETLRDRLQGEWSARLAAKPSKGEPPPVDGRMTVKDNILHFDAVLLQLDYLFRYLDGLKDGGPFMELGAALQAASSDEVDRMRDATQQFIEIIKQHYTKEEMVRAQTKALYIPAIDGARTKSQIIAYALNLGNQYNRDALLQGEGWSEAQLQAVIANLDDRDWGFVQALWNYVGQWKEESFALDERTRGSRPPEVLAQPFTTPTGRTLSGGYWPVAFSTRRSDKAAEREARETIIGVYGSSFRQAATNRGRLKARQGTGKQALSNDWMGVLQRHATDSIRDITHREIIITLRRVKADPELRDMIVRVAGTDALKSLDAVVHRVAQRSPADTFGSLQPVARFFNRNNTLASMGFKFTVAIMNLTGFLQPIPRNGIIPQMKQAGITVFGGFFDLLGRHVAAFATGKKEASRRVALVYSKSDMMRNRYETFDRDMSDARRAFVGRPNLLRKAPAPLIVAVGEIDKAKQDFAHILSLYVDKITAIPTWLAAYETAMSGKVGGVKAEEQAAIDYADSVVRMTLSSGAPKDLSALTGSTNEWQRMWTQFMGWANMYYNQMRWEQFPGLMSGKLSFPRFAANMFWIWALPAVIQAVFYGDAEQGEDESDEEYAARMAMLTAVYPLGAVPYVRDAMAATVLGWRPQPVLASATERLQRLSSAGGDILSGEGTDEDARQVVKQSYLLSGLLLGLPTQFYTTGDYAIDLAQGEEDLGAEDAFEEAFMRDTR